MNGVVLDLDENGQSGWRYRVLCSYVRSYISFGIRVGGLPLEGGDDYKGGAKAEIGTLVNCTIRKKMPVSL